MAKHGTESVGKSWFFSKSWIVAPIAFVIGLVVISTSFLPKEEKIYNIGIAKWLDDPEHERNLQGFKESLAENGYVEGRNVVFIEKGAGANSERQREIIRSFVSQEVDLIYSLTTPSTIIAKGIVKETPIVFTIVTYPVESGIINSLENSGNNLVGTRNYVPASLQYFVFEQIFPNTKTLAFVHRRGEPNSVIQYREFSELLAKRGIVVLDIAAIDLEDMEEQLEEKKDAIDSVFTACDTLVQGGGQDVVVEFTNRYKKPSFSCIQSGVEKGLLVGAVTDLHEIGKISGEKAALILDGAKPSWLSTEQPREELIVVNLDAAKRLGLTVPQNVIDRAKEIIGGGR